MADNLGLFQELSDAVVEMEEERAAELALRAIREGVDAYEAIDQGAHPPTWRVLHDLGAARVRFSAADLVNINTREELEALQARLG